MECIVVQLTDCHIGHDWGRDAEADLNAAVDVVAARLPGPADAVVVTGDIANNGDADEYRRAREALQRLDAPIMALPGNHDDRAGLADAFGIASTGREDLSHTLDLGPLRLIGLDTQRTGEDGGQFDEPRRHWLHTTLTEDRTTPVLLAMHHQPLVTGVPSMDAIGFPEDERLALVDTVAARSQVRRIVAGHVHRVVSGAAGATPVLTIPATTTDLALDFSAPRVVLADKPPAFALHLLIDGEIVSHVGLTADGA